MCSLRVKSRDELLNLALFSDDQLHVPLNHVMHRVYSVKVRGVSYSDTKIPPRSSNWENPIPARKLGWHTSQQLGCKHDLSEIDLFSPKVFGSWIHG